MRSTHLLVGCLILFSAATLAEALLVTYDSTADVYVEWNKDDRSRSNRNSKGVVKQQFTEDDANAGTIDEIVKSYLKFAIDPNVKADPNLLTGVTLRLVDSEGYLEVDNHYLQVWALPNSMDGWDETTLTWEMSVSSYGNKFSAPNPSSPVPYLDEYRFFTAGQKVFEGYCDPNSDDGTPSYFDLDVDYLQSLVAADDNNVITLAIAASVPATGVESSIWGDHEKTEPYRPQVTWDYIPEPATAMLLGLGALALIRRKRS